VNSKALFAHELGRRDGALRDFAAEFGAKIWAQFFLKLNLSHPAIMAVISETEKPEYMVENLQAGRCRMPDATMHERMIDYSEPLS
jgi:aryl-alcohol dehydrogenase-like predicted oxidoreductase